MAKLKKADLKQIRYVSMTDYFQAVDQYESFEDKLAFTTRYLLQHGEKENPDYSFTQAVHLARMKLGDEAAKLRKQFRNGKNPKIHEAGYEVNPYAKNDLAAELFFADPSAYLAGEAKKVRNEIAQENIQLPEEKRDLAHYTKLHKELTENPEKLTNDVSEFEDKHMTSTDVLARMEAKRGGRQRLEEAYNATKPGFFSKMFGTSSKAYTNLDEVYQAFQNPKHVLYGDLNSLGKAATQYLEHKIPGWKSGQPISQDVLDRLDKSSAARVRFSINILESCKEQRELESEFDDMVNACVNKNLEYEDIEYGGNVKNLIGEESSLDISDDEDLIDDDDLDEEDIKKKEQDAFHKELAAADKGDHLHGQAQDIDFGDGEEKLVEDDVADLANKLDQDEFQKALVNDINEPHYIAMDDPKNQPDPLVQENKQEASSDFVDYTAEEANDEDEGIGP